MRIAYLMLLALSGCAGTPLESAPTNLVVSKRSPALSLAIHESFRPLPPLQFPIENLTDADRRIFVDAGPDKVIDRLVIIQFERVQAGSDFRFLFPSTPPRKFGSQTYRFGTFAFDEAAAAEREPMKEPGQTRRFLRAAGYTPARLYRVARLARVTDPDGLSEVIIFYMENADRSPPAGPEEEGGGWSLSDSETAALTAQLDAAVRPVKG